jgi:hypothetical protein
MDWRKMRDMVIVLLLVIPTVFLFLGVGEWCTPSANAADVTIGGSVRRGG